MALDPGNEECTEGLAKELHDFWVKPINDGGMGASDEIIIPEIDPQTGQQTGERREPTTVKRLCYNLARILIDHIIQNMEIYGIQSSGDFRSDVHDDSGNRIGSTSGTVNTSQTEATTNHVR